MEKLEIIYPNGRMVINVGHFFPCLMKDARKLYPLIKQYCPGETRAELGRHLRFLSVFYKAQVESGGTDRGEAPFDWDPGGVMRTEQPKTLLRQAEGNYKLYCQMEVDDEWMK